MHWQKLSHSIRITPYWASQFWGNGRVHIEVDVWSHGLQVHTSSKALLKSCWLSRAITLQLAHLAEKKWLPNIGHLLFHPGPSLRIPASQLLPADVAPTKPTASAARARSALSMWVPSIWNSHCEESASRTCRAQFSVAGDNAYLSFQSRNWSSKSGHTSSEIRTLLPKSGPRGTGKPNWWFFGDQSPMG